MSIRSHGCLVILFTIFPGLGYGQTYNFVDQIPIEPAVLVGSMFSEKESIRKPRVKAWRQDVDYVVHSTHKAGALHLSHRFDRRISVYPSQNQGYHQYSFYRKIDSESSKLKNRSTGKSIINLEPDQDDIEEDKETLPERARSPEKLPTETWTPVIIAEAGLTALIDSAYLCGFTMQPGGTYIMKVRDDEKALELARQYQFGVVSFYQAANTGKCHYEFYSLSPFTQKDYSEYISVISVRSDPYFEEILLSYEDLEPDFLIYTNSDGFIINYGQRLSHSMIPYQEIDIGEEVQLHLFLKGYLRTTLFIKRIDFHEFEVNGQVLNKEPLNIYRAASMAINYWLMYYGHCPSVESVAGTTTRSRRSIDSLQVMQTNIGTYMAFGTGRFTVEQEKNNQEEQAPQGRLEESYPFQLEISIEEGESTIFNIVVDHEIYDPDRFYYQYFSLPTSWATVFEESNYWSHKLKVGAMD